MGNAVRFNQSSVKIKSNAFDDFGQAIMEFTFSMIIVFMLAYAIVTVFQWTGVGLVERNMANENSLIVSVDEGYTPQNFNKGPVGQLDPFFYKPRKMRAVWGE